MSLKERNAVVGILSSITVLRQNTYAGAYHDAGSAQARALSSPASQVVKLNHYRRGVCMAIITNTIRRLRFEAGEMTQKDLAEAVGVTRQTLMAIENGKYFPVWNWPS